MNPSLHPGERRFSRRNVLALSWGALLAGAAPGALWAQGSPQTPAQQGRLIVVFLRGAYDGLSAFVPHADPHYARLRPSIAIPAPDGTAQTALKLDDTFALHPSLAPLMPLWQQRVLAFVPASGLPTPVRSHFEAQHYWEIGQPGKNSAGTIDALTAREIQVLRLFATGLSTREVAANLGISPKTVDTYKQRINEKLGLSHRADYVQFALRLGLLAQP